MPRPVLQLERSTSKFYSDIAAAEKIRETKFATELTKRCEGLLKELEEKLPNINLADVVKSHSGIKELENLENSLRNILYHLNKQVGINIQK